MKYLLLVMFVIFAFASGSFAGAPKKSLYLQCGPHLVAIGTSMKQKMRNITVKEWECAAISHDVRTLWVDTKIGEPIEIEASGGVACKDFHHAYTSGDPYAYVVDRITGNLIWKKRYERVPDCSNYDNLDFIQQSGNHPCNAYRSYGSKEKYYVTEGTYECVAKTKSQLNSIIKNHNNNIEQSERERKF